MRLFKFRKKTTRSPRSNRTLRRGGDIQKLHIQVNSPRIVMIQVMSGVAKGIKCSVILAAFAGLCWGGYSGLQKTFVDNDKYRLQELKLETNGHLDHARVVDVAAIDLDATLFAIDVDRVQQQLRDLPEVIDCQVKRRLPGTLHINLTERVPVVWLQCQHLNFPGRAKGGVLADEEGITFPCEGAMWQTARDLPVIEIKQAKANAFQHGEKMQHLEALRALHLIKLFADQAIRNEWLPERITLKTDYSMEALCNDGSRALFGMYEHQRQMSNFLKIAEHSRQTDRVIRHINLIPKKNIPVKFAGGPILVQPSSHPEAVSPHNQQIRSILDRN